MTIYQKISIFFLRISAGSLFLYGGLSKIFDSTWTAEGYIKGAVNFTAFFGWLASPSILPIVDALNKYGMTLLGISLILGIFVRFSAPLGALLMLLYYIALPFPMPNTHALVVNEHIMYIFALLVLAAYKSGRVWGLDGRRA